VSSDLRFISSFAFLMNSSRVLAFVAFGAMADGDDVGLFSFRQGLSCRGIFAMAAVAEFWRHFF